MGGKGSNQSPSYASVKQSPWHHICASNEDAAAAEAADDNLAAAASLHSMAAAAAAASASPSNASGILRSFSAPIGGKKYVPKSGPSRHDWVVDDRILGCGPLRPRGVSEVWKVKMKLP